MEYALKRAGFHQRDGNVDAAGRHRVKPDWQSFYRRPEVAALWDQTRKHRRIRYLVNYPARVYLLNGAVFELGPFPPPANSMSQLVEMVLRVRNNLFHGDKMAIGLERDAKLLSACLALLDVLICVFPNVQNEYENP